MTNPAPETTTVVGVGGKLRSGKDTVADHLVDVHGFRKLNMSTPIDEVTAAINPIIDFRFPGGPLGWLLRKIFRPVHYIEYREKHGFTQAKEHPEFRGVLQRVGYDAGRMLISDTIWVDMIRRSIAEAHGRGSSVVLSGVRFPNEQDLVHDLDGTLLWVERPSLNVAAVPTKRRGPLARLIGFLLRRPAPTSATTHATEVGLNPDTFDVTVTNDGTLADLYARAESALNLDGATR